MPRIDQVVVLPDGTPSPSFHDVMCIKPTREGILNGVSFVNDKKVNVTNNGSGDIWHTL